MKSIIPVSVLMLLGLCAGCTLDNPADGPQTASLTLQVQQDLSQAILTWPKVNVTGFEEYIQLQSHLDIPDTPEPVTNQNVSVVTRIDQVDVTSFSTLNTLFTPQICYKLYAKVNGRFLFSPTVCIDSPVELINGFFDRIGYNKADNDLVMFDRVNHSLTLYDLDNSTVIANVQENSLSFPVVTVSSNQDHIASYYFDQNQSIIRKYNLPSLGLAVQRQIFDGILGGIAFGPWVFLGTQNSGASFQVLDANSLVLRDSRSGVLGNRQHAVFPGDTMTVLEVWETGMRRYGINTQGKVVTQQEFLTGVSQISTQNACDVNDQYFIGGRFSTIVDKDANVISSLSEDINTFAFLSRFSEDGNRAVVITQDQVNFFLNIYDITHIETPTLIRQYPLPQASYSELVVTDDIIFVVGINFNSSISETFILKIPAAS